MLFIDLPGGTVVKNPHANAGECKRLGLNTWVGKIPWRRKWQLTSIFLPEKFYGYRNLAGYSPWGHSQMIE